MPVGTYRVQSPGFPKIVYLHSLKRAANRLEACGLRHPSSFQERGLERGPERQSVGIDARVRTPCNASQYTLNGRTLA